MADGAGDAQTLVVVGNGMTSHRLCRRLVECGAAPGPLRVIVFGEEPRPAYDRVRLTELLAGRGEEDLWLGPPGWYDEHGIELLLGDPVVAIDRDECAVRSASGATVPYDRLVLATGSRPFVPPVPGTDLPGVFVYRTVDDLNAIVAFARDAERAAVVGGGLLGLEVARALADLGLEVHVVEGSQGLLPRQLDQVGARLLGEKVEALGLEVHLGARISGVERAVRGLALTLVGRERIAADLVVLSAGIRPRGELAVSAGLEMTGGGVVVDDHLASSDPRIFAVGECAAHRGVTYGLVAPGYRMVDVLVDNLVGGDAHFQGADRSALLKLLGVSVAALGRYEEGPNVTPYAYVAGGVYRKLLVRDDRIVGAVAVGDWDDLPRVREALAEPRGFSFWDLRRFRSTGSLSLASESRPVREWAAEALVCGCAGVSRGALAAAEAAGCATVEELSATTGAGTVCGACRPLLAELVRAARDDDAPITLRCGDLAASPEDAAGPRSQGPRSRAGRPSSLRPPSEGASPLATLASATPSLPRPPSTREIPPPLSSRPAIYLPPSEVAAIHCVPAARAELATLPSADLEPITQDGPPEGSMRRVRGTPFLDEPAPPSVPLSVPTILPPPSSTPLSVSILPPPSSTARLLALADPPPASSRRDSMPPLRPISVPPSAGRPSGRLAPSVPASVAMPMRRRSALLATSALALGGVAVLAITPAAAPATSVHGLHAELLWTHLSAKHASGYAIVVLSLLGLVLSVRKRSRHLAHHDVGGLRVVHGALGAAALAALACHTGLRVGERLDLLLSVDFFAAAALGGVAAAALAIGDPVAAQARRLFATRAHLYLLLPLPVLVVLHVLGAYYF